MRIKIAHLFRTHTKLVILLFLSIGIFLGILAVKIYPYVNYRLGTLWAKNVWAPCTPLIFDDLYMTKEVTLYVRDHFRLYGNLAGCIPRKPGCVDDNSVWSPEQWINADKGHNERVQKSLPTPLSANGLKTAMEAVFKRRNTLYSQAYSRKGETFKSCPIPAITIVDHETFRKIKLQTPEQKKIEVTIQRVLIEERNFYLVAFYVHQLNRKTGLPTVDNWGTPWLVMESVEAEEIMHALLGSMSVNADLFGVDQGTYPSYFK